MITSQSILTFWFDELAPKQWWVKDPNLDLLIKTRFGAVHVQAAQQALSDWRETPQGRLAEVIVLDQFSRNIYRDLPQAFAQDALAVSLAKEAVAVKADEALSVQQRSFLYMPFMHSESLADHEEALRLFAQPGMEGSLDFEKKHKVIIDRFGRYPHRNAVLGRESTEEERRFLEGPNSSF